MELGLSSTLLAGDPRLVDHIVGEVKSQGIFDQFRKECIADVDTKPAYQNLHTRVEGSVNSFLSKQVWKPDLNKNQLRETLRKHIHEAPYLDAGIERIVDQVVNPKVYPIFMPQIEDVVYKFLGIERPKTREKNGACGLKDLLPKDLDPVSPESDKNSLKDESLESIDAIDDGEPKKDENGFNQTKLLEDYQLIGNEKDCSMENGQIYIDEKLLDEEGKNTNKTSSNLNLNISGRSDDKTEEEEEDSPTFEPIDIMNLNESNISNDSHLSGISELTSHKSRSPGFSNELSHDNFEYSNQDSQLSKVSSDSRLSIVTDFGSSNHDSTPMHDLIKDETNKEKCDRSAKDNFKAVRDFDTSKNKTSKSSFELNKSKDILQDTKEYKPVKTNVYSKENSRDSADSSSKERYEHKHSKDKSRESESSKSKSKDRHRTKDKYHKDRSNDRTKDKSRSSSKNDKYDKNKIRDKNCQTAEKPRESSEKLAESPKDSMSKSKEDKPKEQDKKDITNKEVKDLKDLYKEKIRELREKKELTEKEKLNKDVKDPKPNKDAKDEKECLKDKKLYKKDHKSSSSRSSTTSGHDSRSKTFEKSTDSKDRRSESKDKGKRDERHTAKDTKTKNHVSAKTDAGEKLDKQDSKKILKSEDKNDKPEIKKESKLNSDKANGRKESKNHVHSRSSSRNEKSDGKRDYKTDAQNKEKKRKDEKKPKSKEDHCSLRKDSNDRRSSDRDGSNGSSSKSSQSSTSSSVSSSSKSNTTNLLKETGNVSNSSSETSDSIEEMHPNELKSNVEKATTNLALDSSIVINEVSSKDLDSDSGDGNVLLKKRSLFNESEPSSMAEVKVKKPKFAKNIYEAKKLIKLRKQMEKQKMMEDQKQEKPTPPKSEPVIEKVTKNNIENVQTVPDEERVQIIEVADEEYEEPYPEQLTNLTLEETAAILGSEPCSKELQEGYANLKLKLTDLELCIGQSISDESSIRNKNVHNTIASDRKAASEKDAHTEQRRTSEDSAIVYHALGDMQQDRSTANSQEITEVTLNCKLAKKIIDTPSSAVHEKRKSEKVFAISDDNEDCRYFKADNEELEKFSKFLESFQLLSNNCVEDIIECLGGQLVFSKAMAPPQPKRKHSLSPLRDILLNNSNNNNDGLKNILSSPNDDSLNSIKKRKLIAPKKQRLHSNSCAPQGLLNGENFVMPLSPESDVSATSEKIPSGILMKEDKSRHRSSQRYSSDDLYKPRPLFSSSSRRSRRSNQA